MPGPWEAYQQPRQQGPNLKERETLSEISARQAAEAASRASAEAARASAARTRGTPLPEAPKNIARQLREQNILQRGKIITESAGKAFTDLGKVEASAARALQRGIDIAKHPGLTAAVGMPEPWKGGLGLFNLPGTPAFDFQNKLETTANDAFLQAFESLKGAGAITGTEGEKATKAIANLNTSTSEKAFKQNLQEYMDIVAKGVQRVRGAASAQPIPYPLEALRAEKERRRLRVTIPNPTAGGSK
jgi:hypothetical protein